MKLGHRKQTPRVIGGRTQKKNNWTESPAFPTTPKGLPRVIRERPGPGYRHVLLKRDIERFVRLLPDWDTLSEGLEAIVLARADPDTYGLYNHSGIIELYPFPASLRTYAENEFFETDRAFFDEIGIPYTRSGKGYTVQFTLPTARAFQLTRVLVHELGHHHDRMTTRTKREPGRGEPFAIRYERENGAKIWERYLREFGSPL